MWGGMAAQYEGHQHQVRQTICYSLGVCLLFRKKKNDAAARAASKTKGWQFVHDESVRFFEDLFKGQPQRRSLRVELFQGDKSDCLSNNWQCMKPCGRGLY